MHKNPPGNIIVKSETLKAFPSRLEPKHRCSLLLLLFNALLEMLANVVKKREKERKKRSKTWKRRGKTSIITHKWYYYLHRKTKKPGD